MRIRVTSGAAKVVLAAAAICALVWLPLSHPFPNLSLWATVALVVGVFCLIVLSTVISLQVQQLILRKGGTDAQWLAFPNDPPGLEQLRKGQSDKIPGNP